MILWFVFVNKLMDNFKRVSFGINTPLNSPGLVRQFLELSMKNWNHIVYSKKKKMIKIKKTETHDKQTHLS